jgi:hypothetical protein
MLCHETVTPLLKADTIKLVDFITIPQCHMKLSSGEIQQTANEYLSSKRKSMEK